MSPPRSTPPPRRPRPFGWSRGCLITDDRGTKVELLDPFGLYCTGRDDVIERPVLKSIIDASTDGGSRKLRLSLLFATVFFVAMVLFAFVPEYRATGNLKNSLNQAVYSPVVYFALGYGVLILPWQWRAERCIRRRHITKALLEHHRCAHCGYDLAGLGADAGDCATACPECAAAWKLDATSLAARTGDDAAARRETIRFGILVGVVMTIVGLGVALYYIL